MKKFDLVELKNAEKYKSYNLTNGMRGIVFSIQIDSSEVLFFNPQNIGECILAKIYPADLKIEKEKLPDEMIKELSYNLDKIKTKAKEKFEPIRVKQYEMVELLVEDNKYTKYGIHKGDIGCVMETQAVQGYIEVDFSGINDKGEYYGDCVSVKIDDLNVIG